MHDSTLGRNIAAQDSCARLVVRDVRDAAFVRKVEHGTRGGGCVVCRWELGRVDDGVVDYLLGASVSMCGSVELGERRGLTWFLRTEVS